MTSRTIVVGRLANEDIEQIFTHSEREFGAVTRQRHQLLLRVALLDLAEDDAPGGVKERPELGRHVRTYHLRFTRDALPRGQRIRKPRHFLVFSCLFESRAPDCSCAP